MAQRKTPTARPAPDAPDGAEEPRLTAYSRKIAPRARPAGGRKVATRRRRQRG